MSLNTAELEKCIELRDLGSLCAMVPQAISSEDPTDRAKLVDAIQDIMNEWFYDAASNKVGDPDDYLYLEGLDALHALGQGDLRSLRVEFFFICGEYQKGIGDIAAARKYFDQCEIILKQLMHEQPQDSYSYNRIIYTYSHYPTTDTAEAEHFFSKALDVADERFNASNDGFYVTNLYLLYTQKEFKNLADRIQKMRRNFISECYEKATKDPIFALSLASEFHRWLSNVQKPVSPEIEFEILGILEAATLCATSTEKFDLVSAGHVFSKEGERYKRDDFLLVAESLFSKALSQPGAFSLIYVYIAQAKEKRARLLESAFATTQAEALLEEIKNHYLRNWKLHSDEISYLSHATEYLTKYVSEKPIDQIPQNLLSEIRLMALAAEKVCDCYHWYPYQVLISVCLLMGNESEAKLWLARGYRALNMVIEDKIKKLAAEIEAAGSPDMISFVRRIVYHLDRIDKSVWHGGPGYTVVSQMTLEDFESWLAT